MTMNEVTRERLRWVVRKAARVAVDGVWLAAARRRGRLRVLRYHRFGEESGDVFCLSPRVFESQMRWVEESGLAVSLNRVCDYLTTGKSMPDGNVDTARARLLGLSRVVEKALDDYWPGSVRERRQVRDG